jgi:hypothetical protein
MGKGATNKRKGSSAERHYAKIFREECGFTFCKTSRQSNRMLDDAGVDLNFLPFNVQIKAGYASGLNEFKTLNIIRERLPEMFPPFDDVHKKMDILIHKKDTGRGQRKKETNELVFLWYRDFKKVFLGEGVALLDPKTRSGQKRGWSFEEDLQHTNLVLFNREGEETLVVMTFEKFKTEIKTIEWD